MYLKMAMILDKVHVHTSDRNSPAIFGIIFHIFFTIPVQITMVIIFIFRHFFAYMLTVNIQA